MIKVTYILGAGFSAPAGVPVMGNFISMSKDLYFSDPNRYSYFKSVFAKIDRLSKIKSYFNADLFNIEEVLSILETERQVIKTTKANREFVSLITDVVNHYTPPLANFAPERPANWEDFIFGRHIPEKLYAAFFASMFGLLFSRRSDNDRGLRIKNFDDHMGYSIVTLNYDLLPERFEQLLAKYFADGETMHFQRDRYDETDHLPHLAKIHGSSDSKDIIPPTWAKNTTPKLKKTWQIARQAISRSNHLRIIGYSLPVTDNYVSYLLKAAILRNEHLKTIDVICLDPTGEVKKRYESFISFRNFQFFNVNTSDYLNSIYETTVRSGQDLDRTVYFDLEKAHKKFVTI